MNGGEEVGIPFAFVVVGIVEISVIQGTRGN